MNSLDEWERQLRSQLLAVHLVGELDLNASDTGELTVGFRRLYRHYSVGVACRLARVNFPASYVAWMVFNAAEIYDRDGLWGHICNTLEIDYSPNHSSELGQSFEHCLRRFGLEHDFGGYRYVTPILAHGGIPRSLLPEFFDSLLHPSFRAGFASSGPAACIEHWIAAGSDSAVARPILRFLINGQQAAEDFVAGCLEMARAWLGRGEFLTSEDSRLPESVVDAYRELIQSRGSAPSQARQTRRLRPPELLLDPYFHRSFLLHLPSEPLTALDGSSDFQWLITADGHASLRKVAPRRGDTGLETRPDNVIVLRKWKRLQLEFQRTPTSAAAAQLQRAWLFDPPPPDAQLFVFDPDTGRHLADMRRLPAQLLWIVSAEGITFASGSPDANDLSPLKPAEELPPLLGDWASWNAHLYDLSDVEQLTILNPIPLRTLWVTRGLSRSFASLENAVSLTSGLDDVPLYIDRLPDLVINLDGLAPSDRDPAGWKLELVPLESSSARSVGTVSLAFFAGLLGHAPDRWQLSLASSGILPVGELFGPYALRVSGPQRRRAELNFRAALGLSVRDLDRLYLPDAESGALTVMIALKCSPSMCIESARLGAGSECQLIDQSAEYRSYLVRISGSATELQLRARSLTPVGNQDTLNFTLYIKRLQWCYVSDSSDPTARAWTGTPDSISLPAIEQADSPALLVDFGGRNPIVGDAVLIAMNSDGSPIASISAEGRRDDARRRFDLRTLRDALRLLQPPLCRLELAFWLTSTEETRQPCVYITQSIELTSLSMEVAVSENQTNVLLEWQPPLHLRDLYARIWSLSRPWLPPIQIPLPRDADLCHFTLVGSSAMPPGAYLVEFHIRDPWRSIAGAAERPRSESGNVIRIQHGDNYDRITELEQAARSGLTSFRNRFEQALLYRELAESDCVAILLEECTVDTSSASGVELLSLLSEFGDDPSLKAFRLRLYLPATMAKIFADHRLQQIPSELWRRYRQGLPSLSRLSAQAVQLMLEAPDEGLRIEAIRLRLEENHQDGLAAAILLQRDGVISHSDLIDLISVSPHMAALYLTTECDENRVPSLLAALPLGIQAEVAGYLLREYVDAGVLHLVWMLKAGVISEEEANQTLLKNASFAAEALELIRDDSTARAMLKSLYATRPDVLQTISIHDTMETPFGTAVIIKIESPRGSAVATAPRDLTGLPVIVHVKLLERHGGLKAEYRAQSRMLHFPVSKLHSCSICDRFVATDRRDVIDKHHAIEHRGQVSNLKTHSTTSFTIDAPTFHPKPPSPSGAAS